MSDIRFSIRRQVAVIWHILANIGDAGDDINNLTKGSFNNYVDQILPNFDPLSPSSGQLWTFYMIPTLCPVTKCGLSTDPLPPPLVHVVIEYSALKSLKHLVVY